MDRPVINELASEGVRALIGAGARVQGQGIFERCVVCPGASASAPLRDAIVAPSGRVIPAWVAKN